MKLIIYGAAQTVTGSQYLLKINGHQLLLECGLFQGRRQESYERNRNIPFPIEQVDAAILSHAHIDHCGNLPNLIKKGYQGPIYTTEASAHLANVTLMDSGHIQESDAVFVNKIRSRHGESPVEPIYTMEDAARVAHYFQPLQYNQEFEPIPGVTARLIEAGHILGSAAVVLDINEKAKNKPQHKFRLWFSGDIGRRKLPLLRDPLLPEAADYLLMECTYGDKPHREPQLAYDEMRDVVRKTIERGGKVIIPAFAIGRTQEIVYNLHQMIDRNEIPRVPVFVDSPLAVNVSYVYRQHTECFDEETRQFVAQDRHHQALGFDLLTYTRSVEESKQLNDRREPMIIISASGMAETGRILHHLRNNIENPKNTILIVSWQAPYTLGRRLADRESRVRIFGEEYPVRAEISTIGGLSAHAGQNMLMEYAQAARDTLKQIILVHGEARAAGVFQEKLHEKNLPTSIYPELGKIIEIGE
jgi:metallo-beta-lactamase family protein